MIIPEQLRANCRNRGERQAWLDSLPATLEKLTGCWSLRSGPPFEHANVTCSWVAPVVCADSMSAVLKLGMPHTEGASEIEGLRFWNGDPTVRLVEADNDRWLHQECVTLLNTYCVRAVGHPEVDPRIGG
jgi:hypothetical protein